MKTMNLSNTRISFPFHSAARACLITVIFLLSGFSSYTQVSQQWVSRYNGPGNNVDVSYSMAVDGSGNVYVTGASTGSGTSYDFATIKYNSAGVQQWVQRYNGSGNSDDVPYSISVDGSGNVYVTGYSKSGSASGTENYTTLKYNSSGTLQWAVSYNGPGNNVDIAYSIAVDGSGNVYVTGSSTGSGTNYDFATIKYNSSGVQQWVQRYNGPGNNRDEVKSIFVDGAGNVYVAGYSRIGTVSGTEDYTTIKYNSSGVQQWVSRYNGPINRYDAANSIAVDGSGNVYVTGASTGLDSSYDYVTIKYNSSGAQQWVQRYNGPANNWDEATSIKVDGSGNVYVTGFSTGSGTNLDYATIKYNSFGVQQWLQRYNGPAGGVDQASTMAVDGSGNVYAAGWSVGSGTVYDYAVIKYNSTGVQQWTQRYNGPANANDFGTSMAIDALGNVYVTGYSDGNGTSTDYATIKYSQTVGIEPISKEIPSSFLLNQNYPNPFNPSTKIKFALPGTSVTQTSLSVYDILGREVESLVNEKLKPGIYEIDFDGSKLPSGVYFYRIAVRQAGFSTEDFVQTKRMVLLK